MQNAAGCFGGYRKKINDGLVTHEGVAPLNHQPRTTRAHLTCLAALKAGFYVALSMPFKVSAAQVDARVTRAGFSFSEFPRARVHCYCTRFPPCHIPKTRAGFAFFK